MMKWILCLFLISSCAHDLIKLTETKKPISSVDWNNLPFTSTLGMYFVEGGGVSVPGCRLYHYFEIPHEFKLSDYLYNFGNDILKKSKLYSSWPKVKIEIILKDVGLNTLPYFANWNLQAFIRVNKNYKFSIDYKHSFDSSFLSDKACERAKEEFPKFVEKVFSEILYHRKLQDAVFEKSI